MKYTVYLLNYDSIWAPYCGPTTEFQADEAKKDLLSKGFREFQILIEVS